LKDIDAGKIVDCNLAALRPERAAITAGCSAWVHDPGHSLWLEGVLGRRLFLAHHRWLVKPRHCRCSEVPELTYVDRIRHARHRCSAGGNGGSEPAARDSIPVLPPPHRPHWCRSPGGQISCKLVSERNDSRLLLQKRPSVHLLHSARST
jgi:hypothetical protein